MRPASAALAVLITSVCLAGPASANGFTDYLERVRSQFLTGLNSFVTFPADPVMSAVSPAEEYTEIPGVVPGHVIGAFQGIVMAAYRGTMGTLDMLLSPLPIAVLSPEPRYKPIPGFEWEGY